MLYNSFFSDLIQDSRGQDSKINHMVNDTTGELEIYLDFPGTPKETIEIQQENSILTIKGTKKLGKLEKQIKYLFSVDKKYNTEEAKAQLAEGVLTLIVPKKQENTKKILVQ